MFCQNKIRLFKSLSLLLQTLHVNAQKSESIKRSDLKPNAIHCIRVRSKTDEYSSSWSQWSLSTCLKTEAEPGKISNTSFLKAPVTKLLCMLNYVP